MSFNNLPIKHKLTVLFMLISCMALLLGSVAFVTNAIISSRRVMVDQITSLALITANSCSAALSFGDREDAAKTLASLHSEPRIRMVTLLNAEQQVFATFPNNQQPDQKLEDNGVQLAMHHELTARGKGHNFTGDSLFLCQPVILNRERIGTILVEARSDHLRADRLHYIKLAGAVVAACLLICYFFASRLQRIFSAPVLELTNAMATVSSQRDYRLRIHQQRNDELGLLFQGFNDMLSTIHKREQERDRAQAALAENEGYLQAILDNTNLAISLKDIKNRYLLINQQFGRLIDTSPDTIRGMSDFDLFPPEVAELLHDQDRQVMAQDTLLEFEETLHLADGDHTFTITKFPLHDQQGSIYAMGAIGRDITDTLRLEKQLQKAEKMEVIGQMAGGVAHDLNNILSGVVSYPELLLMQLPETSDLRQPLEVIRESGKKAAAVVADLLTVARSAASVKKIYCLNNLIREYLHSPEFTKLSSLHPGLEVNLNLADTLWNTPCSAIHIQKILMNLITNAMEAMNSQGQVTITTCNQEKYDAKIEGPLLKGSKNVILEVADTGTGISETDLAHIYEPFYTKKIMGRSGTGLGLSVVWNSVQDHGGVIRVNSNGQGTTFTIILPASNLELPDPEKAVNHQLLQGSGSILVVDDEELQRHIASQILTSYGYTVVSVASGEEAITYVREHEVDLLILDMIMDPGINGRETYERIIDIHPGQRAVIASGFSENAEVKRAQDLGAHGFLKKPYDMYELGLAVQTAMQRSS